MKSDIYNLIILDESGSMGGVRNATISGCNETLATIRAAQKQFADTQEHFVSIFVFQSGHEPSRYIIKNEPIANVKDITHGQYCPRGCTPLYDAVGATLADLKAVTKDKEMAIGNVTIITDGLENSSQYYTRSQVVRMIDALKELGWSFNFIGANIDVDGAASALHIDNAMEFRQDEAGTQEMFAEERNSRMHWFRRTDRIMNEYRDMDDLDDEGREKAMRCRCSSLKESARNYFHRDDDDDTEID